MTERAPVHTAVIVAADARGARAAGGVKAAEHALADLGALELGADLKNGADELVPDREPLLDRDAAVVDVQVRAADPARGDLHDHVVGMLQLRLGHVLDRDLSGRLERDGAHEGSLVENRITRAGHTCL